LSGFLRFVFNNRIGRIVTMADAPKGKLTFNQVGQSGEASAKPEPVQQDAGGGELEGKEQPQYITAEQLSKMLESNNQTLLRQMQSWSDKTEARVNKTVKALEKRGIQATPDVARAVLDALPDMADDEPATEPSKPEPAQAKGKGETDEPQHVVRAAMDLIAKAGLDVDKDFTQEEADAFSAAGSPGKFLSLVENAIQEKLAKRGTPARVPGLNTGLGGAARTTMEALQKQFEEESHKQRPDIAKLKELTASMAKLQG
jgi:hypothetical protein